MAIVKLQINMISPFKCKPYILSSQVSDIPLKAAVSTMITDKLEHHNVSLKSPWSY